MRESEFCRDGSDPDAAHTLQTKIKMAFSQFAPHPRMPAIRNSTATAVPCPYGLRTMEEREAKYSFPLFHLSGYSKGCPSTNVDLLLVLNPKHNDTTIRRNRDAAYGQAAGNRNGVPVDVTSLVPFPAGGRIPIGHREHRC